MQRTLASFTGIQSQFPILQQEVKGNPLTYLDSAATTQKPQCVIDAMTEFYEKENANVKRGMHALAERSTVIYENARKTVQKFLHAKHSREIIFTKSTTEGVNLVARSWGEANLQQGDTVLLTLLEHHSNIVPWLQLKEKIGINVEWIGIEQDGALKMDEAEKILQKGKVKLLCLSAVSNVLGVITPYQVLTQLAHTHGAHVLLDAAQLAPHAPVDVQEIGCDFLVFSGHKTYGPTGIGVLYGKEEALNKMPPFLGGGTMVQEVYTDRFTPTHLPEKFEAGTPPIAEAKGLGAALEWLLRIGWETIATHEKHLLEYARTQVDQLPFIHVAGPKDTTNIAGCISFTTPPVHPHDLTEFLGKKGVCLRAGHHCAQPLHDALGIRATTRLSIGVYNTKEDIDRMCTAIEEAHSFFTKKS